MKVHSRILGRMKTTCCHTRQLKLSPALEPKWDQGLDHRLGERPTWEPNFSFMLTVREGSMRPNLWGTVKGFSPQNLEIWGHLWKLTAFRFLLLWKHGSHNQLSPKISLRGSGFICHGGVLLMQDKPDQVIFVEQTGGIGTQEELPSHTCSAPCSLNSEGQQKDCAVRTAYICSLPCSHPISAVLPEGVET